MTSQLSVLILARPGPLRDGLRALLLAMPQIESVVEQEDARLAVEEVARNRPDLALVDAESSGNQTRRLLDEIQQASPVTRRIVLAGTVHQKHDLEAPSAELIILHGTPAAEVAATIEELAALTAASHPFRGEP